MTTLSDFGATCVRARVPEKQGLKLVTPPPPAAATAVRARVPEKQGLKRDLPLIWTVQFRCPGASSRKTRIETIQLIEDRIKAAKVRARVPEKQGLKPQWLPYAVIRWWSPGASSRKTRIETGTRSD